LNTFKDIKNIIRYYAGEKVGLKNIKELYKMENLITKIKTQWMGSIAD
jgi:hypothetical protein